MLCVTRFMFVMQGGSSYGASLNGKLVLAATRKELIVKLIKTQPYY